MSPNRLDPPRSRATAAVTAPADATGRAHLTVPALDVLGDRLERAAATSISQSASRRDRARRTPWAWGLTVAPALAVLAAVLLFGMQVAPAADARVIQAAGRTAGRTTGRFVMKTTLPAAGPTVVTAGGGEPAPSQLQVDGVYDRASGRVRTSIDLARLLASAGGAGTGTATAGFGGTVDTIQDGTLLYLKADVFTRALPNHPEWVSVDLAALRSPGATGPGTVADVLGTTAGGAVAADPADLLDALRGIGRDTHVVERVEIDGRSTIHYRGTVDLEAAAAAAGPSESARLRDGFGRLGLDPASAELPMDVWVDDGGDVRRVETTLDLSRARNSDGTPVGTGPAVVTTDYLDLGQPEPIVVPSAGAEDITPMVRDALAGPIGGAGPPAAPR